MSRHSPVLPERETRVGSETAIYTPQRLEVRTRRAPKAPLWARVCVAIGAALVLVAGVAYGGVLFTGRYDSNVKRENLLPASNAAKNDSSKPIKGPLNILVLGSDSRANEGSGPDELPEDGVKGERSDTILLMHIGPSLDRGYGISFPRDAYVDIPPGKGWRGGKNKINHAFAVGGAPHVVKTIENLSGLTIDHVVMVDFGGVRKITDAVGGVDVYVDEETRDPYRKERLFKKGVNHLDGEGAIAYVRQRKNLPDGDYDRVKRQQQYLHALLKKITSSGVVKDPGKLDDLLMAITEAITVDQSMRVRDLALAMRGLNPTDISFMTLPMIGGVKQGGIWYEMPDETADRDLFEALKAEKMDEYLVANPPNEVTHGA